MDLPGSNDDDQIETTSYRSRTTSMVSGSQSGLAVRKDPNKEYFMMVLLSYKINNQTDDDIMELDGKYLYHKATIIDKIPFHKHIDWIANEI